MKQKDRKILLKPIGLSQTQGVGNVFALVLEEVDVKKRRLPIIIGSLEAQSIAIVMENIEPQRPLTHDLFVNICTEYSIELKEIIIFDLEEGIFYSKLIEFYSCEWVGSYRV